MTAPTKSRPLLPTLRRMAAGLVLAAVGGALVWQGSTLRPTPGLQGVTTAFGAPLDGPLPLDVVHDARLRFQGQVGELQLRLSPLPATSPDVLRGEARHRERNPLKYSDSRRARTLDAGTRLDVLPLQRGGVVVSGPEPFVHRVQAALTPRIPLTVTTLTGVGDQTLDLSTLRLRALTARTTSGALKVTLPARPAGPLSLITESGALTVNAPLISGQPGTRPEALRVNSRWGDVSLDLAGAELGTLSVGNGSGAVRLTLPARTDRGSLTTISGDVTVTALAGSAGNLDIRTQTGTVTLKVPAGLRVRVRFTDRDTLTLPPSTAPGEAVPPHLDVFIDAPADLFHLESDGVRAASPQSGLRRPPLPPLHTRSTGICMTCAPEAPA